MPSASNTFNVGQGTTVRDIFDSLPGQLDGEWPTGRLTHPTKGAYNYKYAPAGWSGYLLDAYTKPLWSFERTFTGGAHTLWPPLLPDTVFTEFWTGLPLDQIRAFIGMAMNAPDPALDEYLILTPNYATDNSYSVVLFDIRFGSLPDAYPQMVFDSVAYFAQGGWVTDSVEVFYRVVDQV